MKKLIALMLSAITMAGVLGGCGQKDPVESSDVASESTPASSAAETVDKLREDEGTTITFAHNQGEYIYDTFYKMGDKFKELTGITVEWMEIPSSDWDTWVTAQFAAGTEPDIVWSCDSPKDMFDQGKLVDLTPYYEQENVFNGRIWKDCFKENALDGCLSNDGTKYIGTAVTFASVALYYNKDAMAALNLGDKAPTTYTELFKMMEVAKEDGTYIPMSVMNSMGWNLTWIEGDFFDALFHDTDIVKKLDIIVPNGYLDDSEILLGLKTGVISYDDPRFTEYFRLMKEFSKYWNEDFNAASWEYEALFNDGKVLFNFNGGWYPGQVVQNGIDINYGAASKPYVDSDFSQYGLATPFKYAAPSGEAGFYVTQKCADAGRESAAVKWLQFMTDYQTGAQMYIDAVMLNTCVKDVVLPEEMAELANVEYGDDKGTQLQKSFKFSSEVSDMYWKEYSAYLDPASTQTAEEFIEQLKADLLPFLDEAIDEYTNYDVLSYVDQVK